MSYKWDCPYDWLCDKLNGWDEATLRGEIRILAARLDSDTLQDLYQSEMEADGYFEEVNDEQG